VIFSPHIARSRSNEREFVNDLLVKRLVTPRLSVLSSILGYLLAGRPSGQNPIALAPRNRRVCLLSRAFACCAKKKPDRVVDFAALARFDGVLAFVCLRWLHRARAPFITKNRDPLTDHASLLFVLPYTFDVTLSFVGRSLSSASVAVEPDQGMVC